METSQPVPDSNMYSFIKPKPDHVNISSAVENETLPNLTLKAPSRFINREISWLKFNFRVLEEGFNKKHPLLERLRFLSISASNLDEFYMVRVAGLKAQKESGVQCRSPDNMNPLEQLKEINILATELIYEQQKCFREIMKELKTKGIEIISSKDLSAEDELWLEKNFEDEILPAISPIAVDPAHPFPFIPNLGFGIVLEMKNLKNSQYLIALVILPHQLNRFIKIPGKDRRYIPLEKVVLKFFNKLFHSFELVSSGVFRVIRDSEMEIDEEAEDLVRTFETALKRRRRGTVVRLSVNEEMPDELREFLRVRLEVRPYDLFKIGEILGLACMKELVTDEFPDLLFPPYQARFPERIRDFGGDCFAAIHAKDILVHHPYESFDVVVQFLKQASEDEDVVAIKQTLYRTSRQSPVVHALARAAEAGKSVTAMIELKARFDEEANIEIAKFLERSGAQVVFGFMELKTHAKLSLVVRKEKDGFRSYAHLGTGNYHPITAKIYTDLSYFTCDPDICSDVTKIFNYMTGYAEPSGLKKISVAPISLRQTLISDIRNETSNAEKGLPARIIAKMNSIVDPDIIDELYRASQKGVIIELIIRGICCLRPGIKGLSENITVKSIIGRFLEHSRIACFGNGHEIPSRHAKVYFSSADWMPRNIDRRIETLVPVTNPTVHQQILEQIISANLKDDEQSWILSPDGSYKKIEPANESFSAHHFFMTNPSLSGRGSALCSGILKKMRKHKKQKIHNH